MAADRRMSDDQMVSDMSSSAGTPLSQSIPPSPTSSSLFLDHDRPEFRIKFWNDTTRLSLANGEASMHNRSCVLRAVAHSL